MNVVIEKCTVAELKGYSGFPALLREYAEECALGGLPAPDEKLATYDLIERSGVFHAYAAFLGPALVGFVAVLTPVIPHYGVCIAVTESLFVGKAYRNSFAGLALLRTVERHASDEGCPGLLVSAPIGGPLAELLSRKSAYKETNRVFFRKFDHE